MNRYAVLLENTDAPDSPPELSSTLTIPPKTDQAEVAAAKAGPRDQPTIESTSQSTHESTGQSPSRLGHQPTLPTTDVTVERPKAFYITKRLDQRLDEAVRYYQDLHGIKKVDRSAIVNAMLDADANWTNESLDRAVGRIMDLLTSRLTD